MRPFTLSQTGVGTSVYQRVNYLQPNFKIGFGIRATGKVTYSVQHSFDDPTTFPSTADYQNNALWFDNTDATALTASSDGNYFFPIQALRLNVSAGDGSVNGTFIQGSED